MKCQGYCAGAYSSFAFLTVVTRAFHLIQVQEQSPCCMVLSLQIALLRDYMSIRLYSRSMIYSSLRDKVGCIYQEGKALTSY